MNKFTMQRIVLFAKCLHGNNTQTLNQTEYCKIKEVRKPLLIETRIWRSCSGSTTIVLGTLKGTIKPI